MMRVLVACEYSGVVRDAFSQRGHTAISCDLLPSETEGEHYQGDVFDIINLDWDLMIAHPPCTYLSSSGLHWNRQNVIRQSRTEHALNFVRTLLSANIPKIALENPVGCITTRVRKPDQYIQPYQFGEDASKKTGLWLKDLPYLLSTVYVEPRMISGKPRWGNQTDSGQNRLGPSPQRASIRSRTYVGIAKAMAEQWG